MQSQTGFFGPPQLSLFTKPIAEGQLGSQADFVEQVKSPCRTSAKLMLVLEEITGWQSEFSESPSSYRNRSQDGMESSPAQGTFSIVDMSADWPAGQFTGHRGKCDRLVGLVSDLVAELQSAKLELSKVRSAMAALPSETAVDQDDEVLVDSFVPKFGRLETGNVRFDSELAVSSQSENAWDDEFDVLQELGEAAGKLVPPPFNGWSLGGTTGLVDDNYLDWQVDAQERIAISVGRIESAFGDGDRQTVLKVEPLTSEYRVAAQGEINAFYHWDVAANQIQLVGSSSQWTRLGVGDAIIASTTANLDLDGVLAELGSHPTIQPTADSIAAAVAKLSGNSERTLVLKRGES